MIKVCQMPPAKLKQEIHNQLEKAKIREAPVINNAGVGLRKLD